MPSRYPSWGPSPFPHLSEIIRLYPEKEPWCAGYAPSQGRRCHCRTNAQDRSSAISLLDYGTEELRAGRSIYPWIEDLAPLVLCRRFHQYQADELVNRWKTDLNQFLYSQLSPMPPIRQDRRPSRTVYQQTGTQSILSRGLPAYTDPTTITPRVYTVTGSETSRRTARATTPAARNITTTATTTSNYGFQGAQQRTSISASNGSTAVRPTVSRVHGPHIPSRATAHSPTPVVHPKQATRRPVEGDCRICLEQLKKSSSESSEYSTDSEEDDDGEEESDTDDSDEESEGEDSEEDDSSEEDSDEEENDEDSESESEDEVSEDNEQDLVWCRTQCGQNFHKACIDQWLKASPRATCPNCRGNWTH